VKETEHARKAEEENRDKEHWRIEGEELSDARNVGMVSDSRSSEGELDEEPIR
jgi:hypothetical protein